MTEMNNAVNNLFNWLHIIIIYHKTYENYIILVQIARHMVSFLGHIKWLKWKYNKQDANG